MRVMRLVVVALILAAAGRTHGQMGDPQWDPYLNEVVAEVQKRWRIPGAAIAIVDGDQVVTRGFGLADTDDGRPVTPVTPFYLASSGKLFTALAAMQLRESGALAFDADINWYLETGLADTSEWPPVTMHHLLTHTGGFDDRLIGYAARSVQERRPLGEYLEDRMPPRVRRPGHVMGYSNHGFGLAGLVVETVSDVPFQKYVAREVLQPLGMTQTGYVPLEGAGVAMADSYGWTGVRRSLGYSNVPPAGGVASTAHDLARLMSALLNPEVGSLSSAVVGAMLSRQAAHDTGLAGRGYAVWEHRFGPWTGWIIGGAAYGYSSALVIIPQRRLGMAVMLNRQEPHQALDLVERSVNWRLELEPSSPVPVPLPSIDRLAGTYRWISYGSRSAERLVGHFMEVTLIPVSDSELVMEGSGPESRWLHIGNGLFAGAKDPSLRLGFDRVDAQPSYLFSNHLLTMPTAFERVGVLDTGKSRALQSGAIAVVAVLAIPFFGISAWRARRTGRGSSATRWVGSLLAAAMVAFAAFVALSLRDFSSNLAYGPNNWFRLATAWPWVIVIAWLAFLHRVVRDWRQRRLPSRLGYLWLLVSGFGLLLLIVHYHWWDWRF